MFRKARRAGGHGDSSEEGDPREEVSRGGSETKVEKKGFTAAEGSGQFEAGFRSW